MPPQGGDHPTRQAPIGTGQFQSTPPHGRRPCAGRLVGNALHGFNPRLRTGGDGIWASMTRTPGSFNPRLRTGGDQICRHESTHRGGFNPRLRTGGDSASVPKQQAPQTVSIHASAREATPGGRVWPAWNNGFNPRLRTGGDSTGMSPGKNISSFNPRLRTGGDAWVLANASA